MFIFECRKSTDSFRQSKSLFLSKEIYNDLSEHNIENFDDYKLTELFKKEYHIVDALCKQNNELFNYSRKYFQFLNHAVKNNSVPIINNDYSDYALLRKNIINFYINIRDNIEELNFYKLHNIESFIIDIKKCLFNYRIMLKSIDTLPDFVIQNCTSELGNQCSFASYHIYHVYLETLWLNFVISLKFSSMNGNQEMLLETESELYNTEFISNEENLMNFNSEIEKEIDWILYNLIALSIKSYEKKGSKFIFSCPCIKDLWLGLQIYIERLFNQNKCTNFWTYYNRIMLKYVLDNNTNNLINYSCNVLYKFNFIVCTKPLDFSLYMLLKVAKLQQYECGDDTRNYSSSRIEANFGHLEYIVKKLTTMDTSINEENMRIMMKHIIQLSNIWSEPKHEIVTLLWEYFHKRLNSAFSIQGKDDISNTLFSASIPEMINDLKSRLTISDITFGNSFMLFNTILGTFLKKSLSNNQLNFCQKIKGRILPKFTINKVLALNEYGLKNFTTLFLIMALATDLKDICTKLQELLIQIPINTLPMNKKKIITMTHLSILYLYTENKYSIAKVALPIKNLMNSCCGLRDNDTISLVKMTLKGFLEIINDSVDYQSDEYVLIDTWIVKYLTICNLSDTYSVIESFSLLLSKLRILCSYQIDLNSSVSSMIDTLFTHILNCTKTLYSNGTSALQLAELSFNFLKFKLDNKVCTEKYGSFEDMLKYFLHTENANDQVMRKFLTLILQDDELLQSMEIENIACQSLLIHCWIKCTLMSKDNDSEDDDTHLMLLICQLKEFACLNIMPSHGNSEQRNLCKFFYAISNAWNNIQDVNEKMSFKKQVNSYLKNIDKYVASAIKAPSSSDYIVQILMTIGTLFLHCSQIIYTRADPSCLLHGFISTIILPPHLFMDKKIHPYALTGICRSWYLFMKGLYQLDYKNDSYIDKAMKDMIVQYLPLFAEKTLMMKDSAYNVMHRMIPNNCSDDLMLETYILDKISINFITCRGKQSHVHSTKALSVILNLSQTTNVNLLNVITSCTMVSIFEQLMFSDVNSINRNLSKQIVSNLCKFDGVDLRNQVREMLFKTCQKHLAFNSVTFFKLVVDISSLLGAEQINIFLSHLKVEVIKVEKMRGVGFDQGLRNGINDIEHSIKNIK